jgi:hypothetical protein
MLLQRQIISVEVIENTKLQAHFRVALLDPRV